MLARLLAPTVAALLVLTVAGCAGDDADDPAPAPSSSAATAPVAPIDPCELTVTVDGVGYHARGIYGDYELDTSVDLTGDVSPCVGVDGEPATFRPVVGVRREWALVGEVDGEEIFFVSDELPPIPADSAFARILVGDFADTP